MAPAVNQIEVHPLLPAGGDAAANEERGVRTESWSPLGKRQAPLDRGTRAPRPRRRHGSARPGDPALAGAAGDLPIPKSATPSRQRENLDVFGFELDAAEMDAITALGRSDGRLFGGDPDSHEEM